jgi:anti-anti-sigma regulatory factor
MTLKIEKHSDGDGVTIRLIGRMQAEHLEELERQVRESGPAVTLDLEEVTLVDVETVRFLGACDARGATLLNCSPYIRDWIDKERELKDDENNDA